MMVIGSGIGSLCVFAPVKYQDPCHFAARILGVFLGSP